MSIEPLQLPQTVSQIVGANIRTRRKALNLSQEALAARLGLTFQQVQKYERGQNRVSAPVLYKLTKILNLSIADFYAGCDEAASEETVAPQGQPPVTSWIDCARRVDDLNPRLIDKLAQLDRAQITDIERIVNHMLPANGDKAAA